MNVQQLIDRLMVIEDKSIPVCIVDISEDYMPPEELEWMVVRDDFYTDLVTHKDGVFLCLGTKE